MKHLVYIILAILFTLPNILLAQPNTGNPVLDNRLKKMLFFKKSFSPSLIVQPKSVEVKGLNVTVKQIKRDIVKPIDGYESTQSIKMGATLPTKCDNSPMCLIEDDMFGTGISFIITLNMWVPEIRSNVSLGDYGLIEYATNHFSKFIFSLGPNGAKKVFYGVIDFDKLNGKDYNYVATEKNIKKLSSFIELDTYKEKILSGFKTNLTPGDYYLVPTANKTLKLSSASGTLQLEDSNSNNKFNRFKITVSNDNNYSITVDGKPILAGKNNSHNWKFLYDDYGSYYILNGGNGALTISGKQITPNATVKIAPTTGSKFQKWKIVKI